MLGPSDTWLMSRSSHQPSEPVYYNKDCRFTKMGISCGARDPTRPILSWLTQSELSYCTVTSHSAYVANSTKSNGVKIDVFDSHANVVKPTFENFIYENVLKSFRFLFSHYNNKFWTKSFYMVEKSY